MTEAAEITLTEVLEKSQAFLENEIKIDFVKLTGTIALQFKLKGSMPDVSLLFFVFFSLHFRLLQHVPFRESKLTHYLQGFFCGRGKVSMIVNINQCASMYDETLNVLKLSAVAQKVCILLVCFAQIQL